MRRALPIVLLSLPFLGVGLLSVVFAQDKPKYSIKDVMGEHKKGKIRDKILDGSATAEEKKKMVEMYTEMAKNKPPKGDDDSWKKLNDKLIAAIKDVEAGKADGVKDYEKATTCKDCHSAHKK